LNHVQNAKPQKVGLGYGEKMTGIQKDIQNAMVVTQNFEVIIC
jgi:hypothetical protein